MSVLTIPTVIGNAISALSSHHGHKKDVHGEGSSTALNSATSNSSSTQSLFGTLLDSVEQVVGIQTPTSAPTVVKSPPNLNAFNAGTLTPASITAAQASLKQV